MSDSSWRSRRELGASLLAASALLFARSLANAAPRTVVPKRKAAGPSKLVVVFLDGGVDDLYTINPKERSQVRPEILPVYQPDELATLGTLRLGPAWRPLEPYLSRMQVITGIQVNTVSHYTGLVQIEQMRRNVGSRRETAFVTRVGEALAPHAPLHALDLVYGGKLGKNVTPGRIFSDLDSGDSLGALHRIANDEAAHEAGQRALASAIATSCSGESCEAFRIVEHLLAKMRGTAAPAAFPSIDRDLWPAFLAADLAETDGMEFAWALYALANDLTPVVTFAPKMFLDSHITNHEWQLACNQQIGLRMRHLLDGLAATKTSGGRALIDEVGIVIVSELGRFPYPNSRQGKDHFPQISATLIGPGLAPGMFGETDAQMMGSKISLKTGRPGRDGTLVTLDDLGRTLLEWVGHPDPAGIGFDGRVMDLCFA